MLRRSRYILILTALASCCAAADWPPLRPAVQWLQTERLRGILFHDPTIEPMPERFLSPAPGTTASAAAAALVGESYFLLLPDKDGKVAAEVTAVDGEDCYPDSIFALFDARGKQVACGTLPPGKSARAAASGDGPFTLLVNSGPACRNTANVRGLTGTWCLDAGARSFYDRTPLHLHFLRDLKLAGFNLAMIDFERLPEDFLEPAGLSAWTAKVRTWTDYARSVKLRVMPSVNLGGTRAEIAAWQGLPPGLYIDPDPELPVAPCPLRKEFWERLYLLRGREVARLSLTNPCVVGFGLDPEMYGAWRYGHYMLSGTCFCDDCFGGFLKQSSVTEAPALLTQLTTGRQRHDWLQQQKRYEAYDKYLEDRMAAVAGWCREELHRINPDFLTDMFVTEIGNWFCRGIARGFGERGVPTLNFSEHTYYGVGYDPEWLGRMTKAYRDWGAEVVQGSAIWDQYFPATEPRFFAAHAYNLITRGQGYWHWPGDNLYRDWGCRNAYYGKPAWDDDFWIAATSAHREADHWLRQKGYASPLDEAAKVPWKGQWDEPRGTWKADQQEAKALSIPAYPVHVRAPSTLYFAKSARREQVTVTARCRRPGETATLTLAWPGAAPLTAAVAADEETVLKASLPGEGVCRLEITGAGTTPEVMLALQGPRALLATSPAALPAAVTKPAGLIGRWRLDEGRGTRIGDSSPAPHFNGTLAGATWTAGPRGSALGFDGTQASAVVPLGEPYHFLQRFSLTARVKLNALSAPGNGATIVNLGPEAPVQHAWWWIAYPPDYALTLEMGNGKHEWGTSFAVPAKWETGRWYHLAVTFERQGEHCVVCQYRDGELLGRQEKDDDLHSGSHDLRIGSYGGLHTLNGALSDVRFYDVVLTPEQVKQEAR